MTALVYLVLLASPSIEQKDLDYWCDVKNPCKTHEERLKYVRNWTKSFAQRGDCGGWRYLAWGNGYGSEAEYFDGDTLVAATRSSDDRPPRTFGAPIACKPQMVEDFAALRNQQRLAECQRRLTEWETVVTQTGGDLLVGSTLAVTLNNAPMPHADHDPARPYFAAVSLGNNSLNLRRQARWTLILDRALSKSRFRFDGTGANSIVREVGTTKPLRDGDSFAVGEEKTFEACAQNQCASFRLHYAPSFNTPRPICGWR